MQRAVEKNKGLDANHDRYRAVGVAGDARTAVFYKDFLSRHGIKAVVQSSDRNGQEFGVVLMVMEESFEQAYELIESQNLVNDYFENICQFVRVGEDGAGWTATE